MHCVKSVGFVVALICLLWSLSQVSANDLQVGVRYDTGSYFGRITITADDLTSARLYHSGAGQWMSFVQYGSSFDVESPHFASLSELNSEMASGYLLELTRDTLVTTYSLTINPAQGNWLPNFPQLVSVPERITSPYQFSWSWSGLADAKFLYYDYGSDSNYFESETLTFAGNPGFSDLTHTVDFGEYVGGPGRFRIGYANQALGLVSNWQLLSGEELFTQANSITYYAQADCTTSYMVISNTTGAPVSGDLNNDDVVNNQDIAPFVLALTDLVSWETAHPSVNILDVGDINGDGAFNNQDIAPFVSLLTGGSASLNVSNIHPIPEPTSLGLLVAGGLMALHRRVCRRPR